MKHTRFALPLAACILLAAPGLYGSDACPAGKTPGLACQSAQGILARSELSAYHGWIKYLSARTQLDAERFGKDSGEAIAAKARLAEWTAKIEADPDIIMKLRGPQEWAYVSKADDSGQPFQINIPTDYDPALPTPISMYCHGYSGNHMEFAQYSPRTEMFELSILGRARGGFYTGLSEVDVMDVIAYVKEHWNIDPLRFHINGGSMGGWASFRYGSRHPDLFASARPTCGFAMPLPLSNMVDLPVYVTHSDDDPVVAVVEQRGPVLRLRELGGMVVVDETTGLGHAAWDFAEGNARGNEWVIRQVARPAKEVRSIDYTATDGMATGAWWAHISGWGAEQRPARFVARAMPDNSLYIRAENISSLDIDLGKGPFDTASDLFVSVNSGIFLRLPSPLPEKIRLEDKGGWKVVQPVTAPARQHTPGGWTQVFDGSLILIVYGTKGSSIENAAMKAAAIAASKSPNCSWPIDDAERSGTDKVSHLQNLYGSLPIKADSEVSACDLASSNIVLIGTATQNSLAARLEGGLPASLDNNGIRTSRGESFPAKGTALALVYRNPEAPQNVLLWYASNDAAFYAAGARLPKRLYDRGLGVDFVVAGVTGDAIYAARSFDNDWNWRRAEAESPLLGAEVRDAAASGRLIAEAFREAIGADFGVAPKATSTALFPCHAIGPVPGLTRYADAALFYYADPVYKMSLSGAELRKIAAKGTTLAFSPSLDTASLDDEAIYSVAYVGESTNSIVACGVLPQKSEWTGIMAKDAILNAAK